jgi:hypothetical protein
MDRRLLGGRNETYCKKMRKVCMLSMRYFVALSMIVVLGGTMAQASVVNPKPKEIVLLGASIGFYWNIQDLPKRIGIEGYIFEYVGEDGFDKTKSLMGILNRPNRPDAIFLKECAAYFPGDLAQYKEIMKRAINDCEKAGIIPIMVTVAPVREPGIFKLQYWKNIVKKIIYPSRPTVEARLRDLTAYNDWLRKYALEEKVALLDLEKALRISESDPRLRPDFDGGDGLHLNAKAYAVLDQVIMPALEKVDWKRFIRVRGQTSTIE